MKNQLYDSYDIIMTHYKLHKIRMNFYNYLNISTSVRGVSLIFTVIVLDVVAVVVDGEYMSVM